MKCELAAGAVEARPGFGLEKLGVSDVEVVGRLLKVFGSVAAEYALPTSPLTTIKSPVITCFPSRSRITSPTDVDVDLRNVNCLNGDEGALHFDALELESA